MRDFSLLSRDLPHLLLGSETNPKPCRASHAADLQKAAGSAGTKPQALLSAWLCGAGIAVPVSIMPGHLPGRRAQNRDLEAVTDRGKATKRKAVLHCSLQRGFPAAFPPRAPREMAAVPCCSLAARLLPRTQSQASQVPPPREKIHGENTPHPCHPSGHG